MKGDELVLVDPRGMNQPQIYGVGHLLDAMYLGKTTSFMVYSVTYYFKLCYTINFY